MTESLDGLAYRRLHWFCDVPKGLKGPFEVETSLHKSSSIRKCIVCFCEMTTSCLKASKRQRVVEMTGAVDSSENVSWAMKSRATKSPSCQSTTKQQVGFGVNKTIDFDSSLPACFIGLRSETRWSSESHSPSTSPHSQRRTISDATPRLSNRDTLPRPPIRAPAVELEAVVLFASSHELLSSEVIVPELIET